MDQLVVLQEIFESYMRGGFPRPIDATSIDGDCTGLIGELLEGFQQGRLDEDVCHQLMNCLSDLYEIKRLGDICRLAGYLGVAARCYNKALSLSSDQHVRSVLFNNLGQVHAQQGYLGRAVRQYENAANGFASQNDQGGLAHVLGNIGSAYRRSHEWEKATDHCERSLKIFQEIEDDSGVAQMTGDLGRIHAEMGNPEKALQYYEKSLSEFETLGDLGRIARILNQMGKAKAQMKLWDESIEYYNRSMQVFGDLDQRQNEGEVLSNLGRLYLNRGDLAAAKEVLERSVGMIPHNRLPARPNAVSWLAVTHSILAQGFHDQALQQTSRGEVTDEAAKFLGQASVCYSKVSDCYTELINIPEIALPDQKMAAGMTRFLSFFALLEAERRDSEAVRLADEAILGLEDALASADEAGRICVEVVQKSTSGMRETWRINLSREEPWKLTEIVKGSIKYLADGALLLSESTDIWPRTYCEASGHLCEALISLGDAAEDLQGGDPSEALSDAADHLRHAEQGFELAAPDLGMLNAFQVRAARQKAEWMARMTRPGNGSDLLETYQSSLLIIGWVLVNTALARVNRFDRIRTWDDSMELTEDEFLQIPDFRVREDGANRIEALATLSSGIDRDFTTHEEVTPDQQLPIPFSANMAVPIDDLYPSKNMQPPFEDLDHHVNVDEPNFESFKVSRRFHTHLDNIISHAHVFRTRVFRAHVFREFLEGAVFRKAMVMGTELVRGISLQALRYLVLRAFRIFAALVVLYLAIDLVHYFM